MVPLVGFGDPVASRLGDFKSGQFDYADGWGTIGHFSEVKPRNIDIAVRCRRCPACLKARSQYWAIRIADEIGASSRTWFGTLTLKPEFQFRCVAVASERLARQGIDLGSLDPDDAFKEHCKPLTGECQRYLKRLRRQAKGLRFCLVVERHKSGLPHAHLVVHERGEPIRHAKLQEAWSWGFSKFNLVAEGENHLAARYVAKYLAKNAACRVKASLRYGAGCASPIIQRSKQSF